MVPKVANETLNSLVMPAAPTRVGVILAALGKLNVTALKYLIVHLNTLQTSIEFEILSPNPEDELLATLGEGKVVDRDKCRSMLPNFRERIIQAFGAEQKAYDLADQSLPDNFVVISLAKFSDEHYGLKEKHVQVQALGNWMRHMAPPSILEFIVVLLMRQAASFVVPALSKSFHLGTKGCLFDFTSDLPKRATRRFSHSCVAHAGRACRRAARLIWRTILLAYLILIGSAPPVIRIVRQASWLSLGTISSSQRAYSRRCGRMFAPYFGTRRQRKSSNLFSQSCLQLFY